MHTTHHSTIESEHSQPPKTMSNASDVVFGAMLLFIYNLTRIFYEKITIFVLELGRQVTKAESRIIKGKRNYIHTLVAEAFIPNPDNLKGIEHLDGNPNNNNVKNLRWAEKRSYIKKEN